MATTTDLFEYTPSVSAAVIFAILFGIALFTHTYQLFRTCTWFMFAFLVGGLFEFAGYIARVFSAKQSPNFTIGPFIIQHLVLLVAPALFAASIYMELGRIIILVHGEKKSIISQRWLTKIFVGGDVLTFLMQVVGAGNMAGHSAEAINRGQTIILIGLVAQIVIFAFFVLTASTFHLRLRRAPTQKLLTDSIPWEKHMWALYGCSMLILIRCVFRLIEYAQGRTGFFMSKEVFMYLFDSVLMLGVMVFLAIVHPSEINALIKGGESKAIKKVVFVYNMV
ncbi:putative RTM1-like protein [Cadophora sp. MPI-SDFR-AT-0126]|nr:putative RTM1-like protein [Leotiomycetes sp. MPI-SDFR-AT-0126]